MFDLVFFKLFESEINDTSVEKVLPLIDNNCVSVYIKLFFSMKGVVIGRGGSCFQ